MTPLRLSPPRAPPRAPSASPLGRSPASPEARALREALRAVPLANARDVANALQGLRRAPLLSLPFAGSGRTAARFESLAEVAAKDLSLARLVEGHVDAVGILHELKKPAREGVYGVWAADPPIAEPLVAERTKDGFRLSGRKPYASGIQALDRALVVARTPDGPRLFDVDVRSSNLRAAAGTWSAVGMADSESLELVASGLAVTEDAAVGGPGAYVHRPGFWQGAVGVSACWFGGALGCLRMLADRFARSAPDAHAAAHHGAILAACHTMGILLDEAARAIDEDPEDSAGRGEARALAVRHGIEQGCQEVLTRTGRASGSSPLAFDRSHARRAADLVVYLRQHHAERDLASLSRLALKDGTPPVARPEGTPSCPSR